MKTHTTRRARRAPRGFILIAVMIIVGSALFVATSLIYIMQADAAVASSTLAIEQSRSLASSGLQVVIAELNAQRDVILDGETPRIEDQYVLYQTQTRLGVVRVLPIGPAEELLVAEGGKLDINRVDAEALKRTGAMAPDLADAIIAYRDQELRRPFQSIAELMEVEGVSPQVLYGSVEEIDVMDEAQQALEGMPAQGLLRGDGSVRGLADLLTVFAFEPALQQDGTLRINLNVPWSEELGDRLTRRFNQEISDGIRQIKQQGSLSSDQDLFNVLVLLASDTPEEWSQYVDTFTFEPHDYLVGRLDINTASLEALKALPGLTSEEANAIIDAREGLVRESRASVVWPALEEVVPPQRYQEIGGRITTRSWNWRVRFAAGTVDVETPDGEMENPVIYEAVIDLSAPTARVAYLRDITQLQTAAMIAAESTMTGLAEELHEASRDELQEARRSDDGQSTHEMGENEDRGGEIDDFGSDFDLSDDDSRGYRTSSGGSSNRSSRSTSGRRSTEDATTGNASSTGGGEPPPRRIGRWKAGG